MIHIEFETINVHWSSPEFNYFFGTERIGLSFLLFSSQYLSNHLVLLVFWEVVYCSSDRFYVVNFVFQFIKKPYEYYKWIFLLLKSNQTFMAINRFLFVLMLFFKKLNLLSTKILESIKKFNSENLGFLSRDFITGREIFLISYSRLYLNNNFNSNILPCLNIIDNYNHLIKRENCRVFCILIANYGRISF